MAEIVYDCPRCGVKHITFDVFGANYTHKEYSWQLWYECFSVCRRCHKSSILVIALQRSSSIKSESGFDLMAYKGSLTDIFDVKRVVSIRDNFAGSPPTNLPPDLLAIYQEGATCLAVGCFNAAATMFRLCLDVATLPLLPVPDVAATPQPNPKQRRDLGLRLPWLLDHGLLPESLRALSSCIKDDGNDAAHRGGLSREDAEDLLDFTNALLDRLISEPARLKEAEVRRANRRVKTDKT